MSVMQNAMQYVGLFVSNVAFEHIKQTNKKIMIINDIDSCLKATLKPSPFRWEMFKSLKREQTA